MRLIHNEQGFFGKVFKQRGRRRASFPSGKMARIIFNALTTASRSNHFQIIMSALTQSLRLQQLIVAFQLREPLLQLLANGGHGSLEGWLGRDIVAIGINADKIQSGTDAAVQWVTFVNGLHLIAKQGESPDFILIVRGKDFNGIAAGSECAAFEFYVIAAIVQFGQAFEKGTARQGHAAGDVNHH